MFKFDFGLDSSNESTKNLNSETPQSTPVKWAESYEILLKDVERLQDPSVNELRTDHSVLKYISHYQVLENLINEEESLETESKSILKAEEKHSDLVTGVYEGGLKIWECTYDLLKFIESDNIVFQNCRVLDLGCGAGILGIFAHLKGAVTYFQDYNVEVIKHVTMENYHLNSDNDDRVKFYSGDWEYFTELLQSQIEEEKFDFILTSETIYNPENYYKLHDTFKKLLKKTGTVYLAAKCYYFGVGGGIAQMEDLIKKNNVFDCSTCWNCTEGVKRSILKLTFKN